MNEAQQIDGLITGAAYFGPGKRYRFELTRRWEDRGPTGDGLLWVMLNPSTAGARDDDATIRRCTRFSRDWGFRSLTVVNLYGLISTYPAELRKAEDPVGNPENDIVIAKAAKEAQAIVLAWGANAPHPERCETVIDLLRTNAFYAQRLRCLGQTKDGHPRHPLRLAADTKLEVFRGG